MCRPHDLYRRQAVRRRRGFVHLPGLLITAAVVALLSTIALLVARTLEWSPLATVGCVAAGPVLLVLWLQHRNVLDWLRDRGRSGDGG